MHTAYRDDAIMGFKGVVYCFLVPLYSDLRPVAGPQTEKASNWDRLRGKTIIEEASDSDRRCGPHVPTTAGPGDSELRLATDCRCSGLPHPLCSGR
jgi:hypothetical protein